MGLCASTEKGSGPIAVSPGLSEEHDEALHLTRTASVVSLDLLLDNAECFKKFTEFMIECDKEHLIQFIVQLKTYKVHMLLQVAASNEDTPNTMRYQKLTYSKIVSPIASKVQYSEKQNEWAKENARTLYDKFVNRGAELDRE